jgi:hypothetical protein
MAMYLLLEAFQAQALAPATAVAADPAPLPSIWHQTHCHATPTPHEPSQVFFKLITPEKHP